MSDSGEAHRRVAELEAEVARLKAENSRLSLLNEDKFRHLQGYRKAADDDRDTVSRLESELAAAANLAAVAVEHTGRLAAELRKVEWGGPHRLSYCPSCDAHQEFGHAPDCTLAAALAVAAPVVDGEIGQLKAERDRLIEALKPFACMATWLDAMAEIGDIGPIDDETIVMHYSGGGGSNHLTVGQFRAAVAALDGVAPKAEERP